MAATVDTDAFDPDVNDLDRIVSAYEARDLEEIAHAVELNADALFTWDYERSRARRCRSSTRRPRSPSGTARPTCRGTPRSTRRRSPAASMAVSIERFRQLQDADG